MGPPHTGNCLNVKQRNVDELSYGQKNYSETQNTRHLADYSQSATLDRIRQV
jgi:hypothetical protein